ncbi:DUF423 domain-containing protein [Rhodocytophaga aerolata]|uniref:DUF423 domain-containing protein n=1 Tax=Rhodocytophaga aerolata TaxID=455078 RepID=A0ABT8R4Y5_9BACT|nr:DUF423 domain-containing protein [Rhodocytophaga aerolata]MDO1447166.1 DUF423 domain-containing protein [Rhodocytophaga aerolata]
MQKLFLLSGAILGGLGVAIGAFGAHALKAMLESTSRTDTFETAVRYQFYHALALLLIGLLLFRLDSKLLHYSGNLMLAGTIIFSGSLYILCMTGIKWLGAITPIGGVLMIAGWVLLAMGITRQL